MKSDLKKLYSVIEKNSIFKENKICENCPILCSRRQEWHWLLPEEAEKLKDKMPIKNKFDSFFFEGGKCPLLKNKNCSIYNNRPLECRLSPLAFYYNDNKLFWILDIKCPYFKRYKNNKIFWSKVNNFISEIEPYFTKKIVKNLIEISRAVRKLNPLIEKRDYIKIIEFKS